MLGPDGWWFSSLVDDTPGDVKGLGRGGGGGGIIAQSSISTEDLLKGWADEDGRYESPAEVSTLTIVVVEVVGRTLLPVVEVDAVAVEAPSSGATSCCEFLRAVAWLAKYSKSLISGLISCGWISWIWRVALGVRETLGSFHDMLTHRQITNKK